MVVFWAIGFILLHQSGEAEMDALSDDQMGGHYLKTWNLSVTANLGPETDIASETDELLEDIEET